MRSTFPEACALLVGFDLAGNADFLRGFQQWISARHPERPELAFMGQVLREVFPLGESYRSPFEFSTEEHGLAVGRLADDLEEYLNELESAAGEKV